VWHVHRLEHLTKEDVFTGGALERQQPRFSRGRWLGCCAREKKRLWENGMDGQAHETVVNDRRVEEDEPGRKKQLPIKHGVIDTMN
jgi:hypothetical protein